MTKTLSPLFGANKIASILLKYKYIVKTHDILAGTVVGIEKKLALVDLGLKHVAFLPVDEIFLFTLNKPTSFFKINDIGEFVILYYNPKTNKTIVSLRKLQYTRLWERFKQIDFKKTILFSKLQSSFWGGKLLNFDDLQLLIPNSHLPKYYKRINTINKEFILKVLEVKEKKHTIIASSRLAILNRQISSIQKEYTQKAYVVGIKNFGVFINILGIKCLLHISEMTSHRIQNIHSIYKKGDQIKVKVIYINSSQGKIFVSAREFKV